ncbi:hypothetical protein VZH09_13925 (plasmid) [Synechococcus elongatus IITB7]|uniref:hypothetical protein n=1 Tax=Synechococcus elongatus TaxID=32046 RepID=UPI0030CCF150
MARGKLEPAMVDKQFKPVVPLPAGVKLASKMTAVRLPVELVEVLDSMPQAERVALLRHAIASEVLTEHWPAGRPLPEWAAEFSPSISAS